MAVYVDDCRHPFGRLRMSHMWADTRAELLDMALRIGVATKWLQTPPKASWEHFDVARSKRALALAAGAIATDRYGPLEHVARLKGDAALLARIAQVRAARDGGGEAGAKDGGDSPQNPIERTADPNPPDRSCQGRGEAAPPPAVSILDSFDPAGSSEAARSMGGTASAQGGAA